MKTDKELLELAAKAAGYNIKWRDMKGGYERALITPKLNGEWWNPIADDGDALRLAVTLQIDFYVDGKQAGAWVDDFVCLVEDIGSDTYAATRRAIVRAAAAIGERL